MFLYNLAIIDNDSAHISNMQRGISAYTKKYGIAFDIHIYDNLTDFFDAIVSYNISLAIISIDYTDFQENNSMISLQRLKLSMPIIFSGTDTNQAYTAFKCWGCGFLLKPVIFIDLENELNKLLPSLYVRMTLPNTLNSLHVLKDGRRCYVLAKDIQYVEKYRNKLFVYTGSDCYHAYYTIKELKQLMNPKQFIQIHQGCMVNWNYVREVNEHYIIMDDCKLVISRSHYKSVLFQQQMHPVNQRISTYYHPITAYEGIAEAPLEYPAPVTSADMEPISHTTHSI